MDSAVRIGAFDIGGPQQTNDHLYIYNVIPTLPGVDEKPARVRTDVYVCLFDIGGL